MELEQSQEIEQPVNNLILISDVINDEESSSSSEEEVGLTVERKMSGDLLKGK